MLRLYAVPPLLILTCLLNAAQLHAQTIEVTLGLGISTLSTTDLPSNSTDMTPLGVGIDLVFSESEPNISVGGGFTLHRGERVTLGYVDLPVLWRWRVAEAGRLVLGPVAHVNVACSFLDRPCDQYLDGLGRAAVGASTWLSLHAGFGLTWGAGDRGLQMTYQYGISPAIKENCPNSCRVGSDGRVDDAKYRLNTLSLSLFFALGST